MINLLLSASDIDLIIKSTLETLYLLLISGLISIPVGSLLGFLLVYGTNKGLIRVLAIIINIIRSIPFILLMIIVVPISYTLFGTSIGFIPSIISLIVIGIATVSRSVSQSIVELNPIYKDLAQSMGARTWDYFRYFVIRETRSSLIMGYTSSIISLLAYSSVLYIIGGGGLGFTAIQVGYFSPVGDELMWVSVIIMIILVQLVQMSGTLYSRHLNKKRK